jgi:phage shock protein PspC (stress-responsive transcriptional regulator)
VPRGATLEAMNNEPKRLLRSADDRVLGGVAGGLGRYFQVDPIIFRIGFAALTFVGGLGAIAYVAALLFVPEDDGSGNPKPFEWTRRRVILAVGLGIAALIVFSSGPLWWLWDVGDWGWGLGFLALAAVGIAFGGARLMRGGGEAPSARRILGMIVVGFAGFVLCAVLAIGSMWATAEGGLLAAALVVVALGAVMVATSLAGMKTAWLAVPALAIALPAGAVAATDFELHGPYGERTYTPTYFGSVPPDGYEMAVGEMEVDLRELPWKRGSVLNLETDMGIGQLRVIVPEEVCVDTEARVDGGGIYFRGDEDGGVDYTREEHPPASSAPRLVLDADLSFGEIVIADRDDVHHGDWHDDDEGDDDLAQDRAREACEAR